MKILVSDKIYITEYNTEQANRIKKYLTLPNPTYNVMLRRRNINPKALYAVPQYFKYYKEYKDIELIEIGRGNIDVLLKSFSADLKMGDVRYNLSSKSASGFKSNEKFKYRDYQVGIPESIISSGSNGIIKLSTGFGKSIISLKIAEILKKKTLIIVHRDILLNQFVRDAKEFFGYNLGIIRGDDFDINGITIASIHTLINRDMSKYRNEFGTIIVDECFKGDVEILTENGFVRFDNLNNGIKVAQYDIDSRDITFTIPEKIIRKEYDGNMITIKSDRNIDITSTENHDMVISRNNVLYKIPMKNISKSHKIPVCGTINNCKNDTLTSHEKLMIVLQADGSIHSRNKNNKSSLLFSFTKERKINSFLKLMKDGNFNFNEVKSTRQEKRRFIVTNITGATKNIRDHFNISDMSINKCKEIIEYMVQWDGSIIKDYFYYYSSVVKDNADFYQEVAILCGYKTIQTIQIDNRSVKYNDVYRLFINKRVSFIGLQQSKKTVSKYIGTVFCVRVKTGNIIVRYNGKPLVVGNCHEYITDKRLKAIQQFNPQYLYGMSGTPDRGDGQGKAIRFTFGKILIDKQLPQQTPTVETIKTNIEIPVSVNYADMIFDQVNNKERNSIIRNCIEKECKNLRRVLVLTKRIEHYKNILDGIDYKLKCYAINSSDDNSELMQKLRRDEIEFDVILGTFGLLSTGVDIPSLDTLIIAGDLRSSVLTLQSVGRILRIFKDKQDPKIVDICDNKNGILYNQYRSRLKFYKDNKWILHT